jgi:hypothetical protein
MPTVDAVNAGIFASLGKVEPVEQVVGTTKERLELLEQHLELLEQQELQFSFNFARELFN